MSGYIAMAAGFVSIYSGLKETVAKKALEKAGTEATKQTLSAAIDSVGIVDVALELVNQAVDVVVTTFTAPTQSSVASSVSFATDVVSMVQQVNDYMHDKEMAELRDELKEEEEKYANSISSSIFMDGYTSLSVELEATSSPDNITDLIDNQKDLNSGATFKTPSSNAWAVANGVA